MSEVKPTLDYYERPILPNSWLSNFPSGEWSDAQNRNGAWLTSSSYYDRQTLYFNSWLSNFPSGSWIDAQGRNGFWIAFNTVNISGAYEYRISFDQFVNNFTLIFPHVVKTSDSGINKVFIGGIEHPVRSTINYGDMFVVSGRDFRFKVATKHKLSKQIAPIMKIDYKHATFECVALLNSNCVRVRYLSSEFDTIDVMTANYIPMRGLAPAFITSITTTWNYVRVHNALSVFKNINSISVPVIANCKATSWNRFGGIWKSCNAWTQ